VIREHNRDILKRKRLFLEASDTEESLAVPDLAPSAVQELNRTEVRKSIDEVLNEAPQDYKELITAKFFFDFTPTEIAELTGWTINKVYVTTSRAIPWLRKQLTQKYGSGVVSDWLANM
jgi:RNA polymerase sigma factor (sigma-70 family)